MKHIHLLILLFFTFASCEKEETPKAALEIPSTYISSSYDANTATEKAIKTQLIALITEMKTAEKNSVLSLIKINELFNAGNPSLKSITGNYYIQKIESQWFTELINSSGKTYDPLMPNTTGGVYGARLLNSGGLETPQLIEKGLFGAAFYNYASGLMNASATEKTLDQIVAIYGASIDFPNTNTATKTTTPDAFGALYAARRDKNDGNGIYSKIKNGLLKSKAAIKAGAAYNNERDEAFKTIKEEWEKAIMATVIHYNYAALTKLSGTNPPASTLSGALHDLGEGVGFLHGFKAIPQNQRKITDAQIDESLALIQNINSGKTEMYKFISDPSSLAKIQSASTKIQAIYSFTATEMEDFKKNWITEQVR